MAWVLDTNTVVFCLRGKSAQAMRRLHETPASEVFIPCQVLAELLLGAAKSTRPVENRQTVLSFLAPFELRWPNAATVDHYVSIRSTLERQGAAISEPDYWIAATALEIGAAVVTNNSREFERVPGLAVEDWTMS